MRKVAIVTDSTINLPPEIIAKYQISVIPLTLLWGNEVLMDMVDIQPEEFYSRLKVSKVMPTTSQVTPIAFTTLFGSLLEKGYDILAILLSSHLSGTMDSAIQAQKMFPGARITLFDSKSTSLALGFQVLTAARAADYGSSLEECIDLVERSRDLSGVLFVVDTLEFLHRGGRIGGAARFLGTALGLKPILELRSGRIEAIERVRTQKKAFERLIDLVEERINKRTPLHLGILDAGAPDYARTLYGMIGQRFDPQEIIMSDVSPVIGAHAGPGTVGIAFLAGM